MWFTNQNTNLLVTDETVRIKLIHNTTFPLPETHNIITQS